MSNLIIYPYKMYSKSAKALQTFFKEKGIKCRRVTNSRKVQVRLGESILMWGNKHLANWKLPKKDPTLSKCKVMNGVGEIARAGNKLITFQILKEADIPIPEYTTEAITAKGWWEKGNTVLYRSLLTSSKGKGIIIYKKGTTSDNYHMGIGFPLEGILFVKYIPKQKEYRVHVFNNQVIDFQQKKRSKPKDQVDMKIRSHDHGWNFCREGVSISEEAKNIAISAVKALGLTFGAVDLIQTKKGKIFVLEVNTAPGLEGKTVESYGNAILTYITQEN